MQQIHMALEALRFGGAMVYPLLLLAVLAVVVILDKAFVYWQFVRLPQPLLEARRNLRFFMVGVGPPIVGPRPP